MRVCVRPVFPENRKRESREAPVKCAPSSSLHQEEEEGEGRGGIREESHCDPPSPWRAWVCPADGLPGPVPGGGGGGGGDEGEVRVEGGGGRA